VRDRPLDHACAELSLNELLDECAHLDRFRRESQKLYQRGRCLFFLYAIYRFHMPLRLQATAASTVASSLIAFHRYGHLFQRRFEEAIDQFLAVHQGNGPSDGICSALATAYYRLGFQTLANQVRQSVRSVRGNQWMFRMGHPADQPLRIRAELLQREEADGSY